MYKQIIAQEFENLENCMKQKQAAGKAMYQRYGPAAAAAYIHPNFTESRVGCAYQICIGLNHTFESELI